MLIDFAELHRTFLIPKHTDQGWVFNSSNVANPKKGFFPATHQIFSNHALQVAIYIYNNAPKGVQCDNVSHCLYLNFSHKALGNYLLNNDQDRIAFNLDLGVAMSLYRFAVGLSDQLSYSAIRTGKAPKRIKGRVEYRDGERVPFILAEAVKDGKPSKIEVELSGASKIALAAHALGYGRLLYPSLSDTAIQAMFSVPEVGNRACAVSSEQSQEDDNELPAPQLVNRACAECTSKPSAASRQKLSRAIWAIGNQKWPHMRIDALQSIQAETDVNLLQKLVNQANEGDFSNWDGYL